jgi:hypothetical protein
MAEVMAGSGHLEGICQGNRSFIIVVMDVSSSKT